MRPHSPSAMPHCCCYYLARRWFIFFSNVVGSRLIFLDGSLYLFLCLSQQQQQRPAQNEIIFSFCFSVARKKKSFCNHWSVRVSPWAESRRKQFFFLCFSFQLAFLAFSWSYRDVCMFAIVHTRTRWWWAFAVWHAQRVGVWRKERKKKKIENPRVSW